MSVWLANSTNGALVYIILRDFDVILEFHHVDSGEGFMRKSLVWSCLFAAVLFFVTGCDLSRAQSEEQVAKGVQALNAGRGGEAVRAFEDATNLDETNANAWYYLGYARSHKTANPGGAIDALERATTLDEARADAAYELGVAYEQKSRTDDAIEAFRKATLRDPTHAGASFRLGRLLEDSGAYREAIGAYSDAINKDPSLIAAWVQLGNLYAVFGELDAAIAVYENGLENNPDSAEIFGMLGMALYEAGRSDAAIKVLTNAEKEGRVDVSVLSILGQIHLDRADATKSAEEKKTALGYFDRARRICNPQRDGGRCMVIEQMVQQLNANDR